MTTKKTTLQTKLEKKIHTQATLLEFSKSISAATHLEQVYDIIILTCMGHIGIAVTALLIKDNRGDDAFKVAAVKGIDTQTQGATCALSQPLLKGLCNKRIDLSRGLQAQRHLQRESDQCRQLLESIECCLMIPIVYLNDVVGILACGPKVSGRTYADEEIDFLMLIAGHAGVAINNVMAMDACKISNAGLEKRLFELETIEDVNRALASSLDLENVCKTLLFSIMGYLATESGTLFLFESEESLRMRFITSVGISKNKIDENIVLNEAVCRDLRHHSYLSVSNSPASHDAIVLLEKYEMEIALPLKSATELVAVALIGKKATGRAFQQQELALAAMLAGQGVAPIRKSQFYTHLRQNNQALATAVDKLNKEVSVRREAEAVAKRNEQRFRTLLMTANDGFWEVDAQEITLDVNPKLCDILGYSKKELLNRPISDFIDDADAKILHGQAQLRKAGRKSIYELTLLHKKGTRIRGLMKSSPLFKDNVFSGSFSMVTDITERKKIEEELRKYEHIVSSSNDAMALVDKKHLFLQINDACADAFDSTRQDMIGKGVDVVLSGKSFQKILQASIDQTLEGEDVHYRAWFDLPRFGRRYLAAAFYPFYSKHGDILGVIINLRDITNEKRLEEHLVQAQKMEAIGTLAGGIAHDFNNILTAVMGFAELARGNVTGDQRTQHHLAKIIQAGQRARDLVKQILTFSRQAKQQAQPILLRNIVKEVITLLRASLPYNIQIQQALSDASGIIFADPVQIHQVLLNICINAVQAMEQTGGVMRVALDVVEIDAHMAKQQPDLNPGSYLKLSISDTGCGMDDKTMARIFEPYFSTKPLDKGSGLGLATSHGIIKSHGGAMVVDSTAGQGSTFHIFIPAMEGADVEASQGAGTGDVLVGTERILYVDDEPFVLEMATELLEGLGYGVTAERDARKALKIFESDPDQFDIVITDQGMPYMTGIELAQSILSLRPDMPIVLCSGYSEKISLKKLKLIGIRGFIMKPFVLVEMARKIHEALGNVKV